MSEREREMKKGSWTVGMAMLGIAACAPAPAPSAEPARAVQVAGTPVIAAAKADTLGDDIVVRHLGGRIWLHVTLSPDANRIPSNGLLVDEGDGVLLIDTAWDDEQTGRLAEWSLRRLGKPIRRAISTHFHDDRLGGIDTLRALGVDARALDLTVSKARAKGKTTLPAIYMPAAQRARRDPAGFEVFHPGPGHSPDNIVVWFPAEGLLFGGCFVKGAESRDLGNLSDADVRAWPASVARVRERYPRASIVIPGHGAPGGLDLLTHTTTLLAAPAARNGG
jgi:glyoxylase-like metal-dependent hydrolase (beta-lactamase superfamily II)